MKKKLNIDNPFFACMGRLADIVILNLLFFFSSLPVITMGASISAMYQTTQDMRGEHFYSVFRSFTSAWKKSFKKSFLVWIFQFLTGMILVFDIMFLARYGNTWIWHIIGVVIGNILLVWMLLSCYLLPARVYEKRSIREAILQSFYLSVRNLPYTLLMLLLNSIPVICIILGEVFMGLMTPIYIVVGFAITAYLNTILLEKCQK